MSSEVQSSTKKVRRGGLVAGAALILIGVWSMVGQFIDFDAKGILFLPVLGAVFLLWGILTRSGGLLIPGGILTGIGVGVYLMDNMRGGDLSETAAPGVFLLSFAGGWALITLLSLVFAEEKMWWPLIPGGILALVGVALFIGGTALDVLELVGRWWPALLILAGGWIIIKRE